MSHDVLHKLWKPLPASAIVLIPLDEMVARIEAIRLEEAPPECPMCGSTVDSRMLEQKWCPSCSRHLSRRLFGRARNERHGILWECRPCRARRSKATRTKRARRGQIPMPGVAA